MIQRDIEYSGQFSKDVKLAQKRHKDMNKLKYLMTLLINNALPLPADAGCGRDRHLSIHELYSHKRRTAGRRGYKILDACGYPVSVDRLHSSRLSGGPCMASARVLDLYLPED